MGLGPILSDYKEETMSKLKIAVLTALIFTFSIGATVFASDIDTEYINKTLSEQSEITNNANPGDVRNLKITIPDAENLNITGEVEVFYTGENCDIFAALTKDNNYTLDLAVYDGNYELYQILYRGEENYEFLCADTIVIGGNAEMNLLMRDENGFTNADKLNHGAITGYARIGTVIASEQERNQAKEQYEVLAKEVEQIQLKAEQEEMLKNNKVSNNNNIIYVAIAVACLILAGTIVAITVIKKRK